MDKYFEFKALPTTYKGHRFRSRVEARHALFMDVLKIPYAYEDAGFQFEDGTMYLPDFFLPAHDVWYEVKGAPPDAGEIRKARELAKGTHKDVYIVFGNFSTGHPPFPHPVAVKIDPQGTLDGLYAWSRDNSLVKLDKVRTSGMLSDAYAAARGARFDGKD